jgi:hypothetical protein
MAIKKQNVKTKNISRRGMKTRRRKIVKRGGNKKSVKTGGSLFKKHLYIDIQIRRFTNKNLNNTEINIIKNSIKQNYNIKKLDNNYIIIFINELNNRKVPYYILPGSFGPKVNQLNSSTISTLNKYDYNLKNLVKTYKIISENNIFNDVIVLERIVNKTIRNNITTIIKNIITTGFINKIYSKAFKFSFGKKDEDKVKVIKHYLDTEYFPTLGTEIPTQFNGAAIELEKIPQEFKNRNTIVPKLQQISFNLDEKGTSPGAGPNAAAPGQSPVLSTSTAPPNAAPQPGAAAQPNKAASTAAAAVATGPQSLALAGAPPPDASASGSPGSSSVASVASALTAPGAQQPGSSTETASAEASVAPPGAPPSGPPGAPPPPQQQQQQQQPAVNQEAQQSPQQEQEQQQQQQQPAVNQEAQQSPQQEQEQQQQQQQQPQASAAPGAAPQPLAEVSSSGSAPQTDPNAPPAAAPQTDPNAPPSATPETAPVPPPETEPPAQGGGKRRTVRRKKSKGKKSKKQKKLKK